MRRDRLIQAAFCFLSLVLLIGSYPVHAADVPFEKLRYRISANHFIDSMSISMGFSAVEVLERQPGATSVDETVSGQVNWPTTPGGFSAIPYTKYIDYRDNEGHVQKEVKILADTVNTTWSFHNVISADGRVATNITDDRTSEVRFMVINTASLAKHFTFMTWENLYWMGLGTRAYIGPGYAAGQEVEVWVTKWIPNPGLISPEVVKVKLSSLSGVKTPAGSFDVLVGGPPPFTSVHPSRVQSSAIGDLTFQYSYTFYWDRKTGVLVKFDVVGHSINPADPSDTRISYELVEMKASSGPSSPPTTPLPAGPAPSPPQASPPQVPPSAPAPAPSAPVPSGTGSSFAPNMTMIGLGAAVGVGAIVAFAALRTRGGAHRGAKAGRLKSEAGSDQPFKGSDFKGTGFKGADFKGTDFKGGTGFKAGAGHVESVTVKTEGQRASRERLEKMIARLDELKAQGKITNKVYEKLLKEYQEKMKAEEGEQ